MQKLKIVLFDTNRNLLSVSLLLARLTIGILLFIAGSGKILGWFGGYGIEATLKGYAGMNISEPLAYLSCYAEFIGGFLLIIGLMTRFAAFALMINMIVATIVSLPGGFQGPTGAQVPFIFLIMDLIILLSGPMDYSIDRLIFKKQPADNLWADFKNVQHPFTDSCIKILIISLNNSWITKYSVYYSGNRRMNFRVINTPDRFHFP